MTAFRVLATDGDARAGVLQTAHGEVETPVFMPVGTQATVKALSSGDLAALGPQIILGNTYHLALRPGADCVQEQGGLHRFMAWPRAILTDSGGFQVFSLRERRTLDEDGVTFRSHIDGSTHRLTPERAMEIQSALGSDIAMAFDECPPSDAPAAELDGAMARTTRWAARSLAAPRPAGQLRFGIVQGGVDVDPAAGPPGRDRRAAVRRIRPGRTGRRRAAGGDAPGGRGDRAPDAGPERPRTSWAWARRATSWRESPPASTCSTA